MKIDKEKNIEILNVIKKYFLKFIFLIEFIISLILMILVYKTFCVYVYENVIKLKYIIIDIILLFSVISIIAINYRKNKGKIEKIFLSFIIPIGMAYLILMIPTYVPDEQSHMWKSYQISEGTLITPFNEKGESHTEVPEFFRKYIIRYVNKYSDMNNAINQNTDYSNKVEVNGAAVDYAPVSYICSAIGLLLSRLLGLNGIIAMYIARLCNFIVFLFFAYYSIKIIPFGKLTLSCFLFIPMVVHQAISISADSFVNTISIFYIAFNLYLLFKDKKIERKEQILYIILSIIIGLCKIVYLPLVGMSLLLISTKNLNKKEKGIIISISIIAATIVTLGWYVVSMQYKGNEQFQIENNVNSSEQIKWIIHNPLSFSKVLINTTLEKGESYIFMLIGSNLGWLEINNAIILIISFMFTTILSIFFEKNDFEFSIKQKIWMLVIFVGTYLLTLLALYVGHTGIGKPQVEGIQGRYFIPIAMLPLLCIAKKDNYVKIKSVELKMMIIMSFLSLFVLKTIIRFFI